jgi:photosystem II stability/assembly factor-like uncharacterized protein
MTIALSHGGPTIYESISPSSRVLIGTLEGIVTAERDGAGWRVAGRALPEQHISAILIEPESGMIFAGAYEDGSLRASLDGGKTWELRNNGLTETEVFSLAATKVDGNVRLFLGTEPAHLFFSDDLGENWTELPGLRDIPTVDSWSFPAPPHIAHAKHITFDPRDASTMYVSIEVGGLLRSTDGGKTWQDIPGMYEDVHRLVIDPADPNRMFVAGGNGLYTTLDAGASWQHATTREHEIGGYPDQLVFDPRDSGLMFVAAAKDSPGAWRTTHNAGARISRSRDGGQSWQTLTNGLPDRMQGNVEAMSLEATGEGCSIFAATTAGEVFASDDTGESWSLILSGLAPISKGGHYRALTLASAERA